MAFEDVFLAVLIFVAASILDGAIMDVKPRLRILLGPDIAIGPGKADLLEAIGRTGSISAAAREMEMSYRRAWLLVDTMTSASNARW